MGLSAPPCFAVMRDPSLPAILCADFAARVRRRLPSELRLPAQLRERPAGSSSARGRRLGTAVRSSPSADLVAPAGLAAVCGSAVTAVVLAAARHGRCEVCAL